jgi:RNA polymerase sigma factor (sigma-70 family)
VTVSQNDWLAERFEENRTRLRAVAYRILGSLTEADDAVQETWLRLSRSDRSGVENLEGWLTTVVARVCLNAVQGRKSRPEMPVGVHVPDPIVSPEDGGDPEQEALIADGVGLALLVVLDTLTPAERLAFVLHDIFEMPFDEIASIVDRSPTAARKLASRARRRVRSVPTIPDTDLTQQRELIDAFLAAARDGDFEALLEALDPDVVLRVDRGPVPAGASHEVRGAHAVAEGAVAFSQAAQFPRPALVPSLVNGTAGVVVTVRGKPDAVLAFTIVGGKIVEIDILRDRTRLAQLDLGAFQD